MRNGRVTGYSNSVPTYKITFLDGDVSFAEKLLSIILENRRAGTGRQDRRRGREGKYLT
jgi:hypothetical protein